MNTWQIHKAKSALSKGPQIITKRGIETAVVISMKEYEFLTLKKSSLLEDLLTMPKVQPNLERGFESIRNLEL